MIRKSLIKNHILGETMIRSHRMLAVVLLLALPSSTWGQDPTAVEKLGGLTLEEKAAFTTGQNTWETFAVPRLDIPAVWMADGPVGLRKADGPMLAASVTATCFPAAAAMSATWNPSFYCAMQWA